MLLPTRFWSEMSWTDFDEAEMGEVIAVLPVAAIEQHGPHLPVGVDAFIMEGYIARVVARLPEQSPVLFLPVQSCGSSIEHTDFPGALSLSAPTLIRALTEIAESVFGAGCRKLVLLNSHGGNVAVLDIIAHDLRARLGMLAVTASWHRFGSPDGLFSDHEKTHGIHAGDIETSLMLSFRPDLVRLDDAADFIPASIAIEGDFNWLRVGRPTGFGWMSQDLSEFRRDGRCARRDRRQGRSLRRLRRDRLRRIVAGHRGLRPRPPEAWTARIIFRARPEARLQWEAVGR